MIRPTAVPHDVVESFRCPQQFGFVISLTMTFLQSLKVH